MMIIVNKPSTSAQFQTIGLHARSVIVQLVGPMPVELKRFSADNDILKRGSVYACHFL